MVVEIQCSWGGQKISLRGTSKKNPSNFDILQYQMVSEWPYPTPPPPKRKNRGSMEVFHKQNMSSFCKLLIPLMFNPPYWHKGCIRIFHLQEIELGSNDLGIKVMHPLTELKVNKHGQAQGLVDSAVHLCHLGLRLFLLLGPVIMEGWLHHLAVNKMAASFWSSFCYDNI